MAVLQNILKKQREKEEGFTLIELMIVVVIIGILAAIAIPIFANQEKAAVAGGVKSDVKNTVTNVATALAHNPTASGFVGYKVTDAAPTLTTGQVAVQLVQTKDNVVRITNLPDEGSSPAEADGFGKWDAYQVIGVNPNLGDYCYYFSSKTGRYIEDDNCDGAVASIPGGGSSNPGDGSGSTSPGNGDGTTNPGGGNNGGGDNGGGTVTPPASLPVFNNVGSALPSGKVGSNYSYQFDATGNPTFSPETSLPGGLTLDPTTGLLSGKPTTVFTGTITVKASNSAGSASQSVTITIEAFTPVVAYSNNFASGVPDPKLTFNLTATTQGWRNPTVASGATGQTTDQRQGNSNILSYSIDSRGTLLRLQLSTLEPGTYTVSLIGKYDIGSTMELSSNGSTTGPVKFLAGATWRPISLTFTVTKSGPQEILLNVIGASTTGYVDNILVTQIG